LLLLSRFFDFLKQVQPQVNVHEQFGDAAKSVSNFFRRAKATPEWNRKKEMTASTSSSKSSSSSSSGGHRSGNHEEMELMNELAGLHRPSTAAAALAMNAGHSGGNNMEAPLRSNVRVKPKSKVSLLNNLQQNNVGTAMSTSFGNDSSEEFAYNGASRPKKRQMIPLHKVKQPRKRTEADKLADLLTTDAQPSSKSGNLNGHNNHQSNTCSEQEQKRKKRQQEKMARLRGVNST